MEGGGLLGGSRRPSWRLWVAAVGTALVIGLGAYGHWRYEMGPAAGHAPAAPHEPAPHPPGAPPQGAPGAPHVDAFSILYHTLQLLILHAPHLEREVPWQLHVARLLGAFLVFAAGLVAAAKLFGDEFLLRVWLRWRGGHVVICGLGDLGHRLAVDGRRRGRRIVAIESQAGPAALESAHEHGVLVLEGNARDPNLLRTACVDTAEFVVAACPEDDTNLVIASAVGQLARGASARSAPLVCRLLVRDTAMRERLQREPLFPAAGSRYRVNWSDLDPFDTAARQALRLHPLDHEAPGPVDDTVVHLVVVGFGRMGQSLARHAARIGHFANEVGNGIRLRLTVADQDTADTWARFRARHALDAVCDSAFESLDPVSPGLATRLAKLLPGRDAGRHVVTVAICVGDDDGSDLVDLGTWLDLARLPVEQPTQILVFHRTDRGFDAIELPATPGAGVRPHVRAFGMIESVFAWDVLLHESEDRAARALHERYRHQQMRAGVSYAHNPAWEDLPDDLKESNRHAADHIAIKLRALGYEDRPLRALAGRVFSGRIKHFTAAQEDLLARMEHLRWCAERRVDGWTVGSVTDWNRKINRDLVPWDDLPRSERDKDLDQVRAIPDLLLRLRRGIFPRGDSRR